MGIGDEEQIVRRTDREFAIRTAMPKSLVTLPVSKGNLGDQSQS
jgi:hypothetical protein